MTRKKCEDFAIVLPLMERDLARTAINCSSEPLELIDALTNYYIESAETLTKKCHDTISALENQRKLLDLIRAHLIMARFNQFMEGSVVEEILIMVRLLQEGQIAGTPRKKPRFIDWLT